MNLIIMFMADPYMGLEQLLHTQELEILNYL